MKDRIQHSYGPSVFWTLGPYERAFLPKLHFMKFLKDSWTCACDYSLKVDKDLRNSLTLEALYDIAIIVTGKETFCLKL